MSATYINTLNQQILQALRLQCRCVQISLDYYREMLNEDLMDKKDASRLLDEAWEEVWRLDQAANEEGYKVVYNTFTHKLELLPLEEEKEEEESTDIGGEETTTTTTTTTITTVTRTNGRPIRRPRRRSSRTFWSRPSCKKVYKKLLQ